MSVKIKYLEKKILVNPVVIWCYFQMKISASNKIQKNLSDSEYKYINDLLKKNDLKKNYLFLK